MPQCLIPEAVYERTQTLREDDESNKDGVLDMIGHNLLHVRFAVVIYQIKQCGYETQAELDQMQQHRLACFSGILGVGRGRLHDDQDSNVRVDDNHADDYKVGDGEGIVYGGKNGQGEKVSPVAETRHNEVRVVQTEKQDPMSQRLQRSSSPYKSYGHPHRPGRDNMNMLQWAANGKVPLQRHQGEVER